MSELTTEQRLGRLEAVQQITALKHRYLRACDNKDARGFRAAFIRQGAVIDFGPMGSYPDADGIAAVYAQVALNKDGDSHTILDMHHAVHPDIDVTGDDTAEGRWSLRFRQIDLAAATETISAMEYLDRYVIEDGQWKISYSRSMPLWSLTRPLGEVVALVDNMPIDIAAS